MNILLLSFLVLSIPISLAAAAARLTPGDYTQYGVVQGPEKSSEIKSCENDENLIEMVLQNKLVSAVVAAVLLFLVALAGKLIRSYFFGRGLQQVLPEEDDLIPGMSQLTRVHQDLVQDTSTTPSIKLQQNNINNHGPTIINIRVYGKDYHYFRVYHNESSRIWMCGERSKPRNWRH